MKCSNKTTAYGAERPVCDVHNEPMFIHKVRTTKTKGLRRQWRCAVEKAEQSAKYYQENREYWREYGAKYYQENREAIREHYQENREAIREQKREYMRKKRYEEAAEWLEAIKQGEIA